jgi:hypothetical protein
MTTNPRILDGNIMNAHKAADLSSAVRWQISPATKPLP